MAKQDESFAALLEGFSDVTDSVPETAEGSSSAEKAIVYDLPDNVQGEKTVRCGKITAFGESQVNFFLLNSMVKMYVRYHVICL